MSDIKIYAESPDETAVNQIYELAEQEAFKDSKIRIMPDVHAGKGCVIGFTADLGDKIIPNIVGVDINCGMLTVELGNIEIDLKSLDEIINKHIPAGKEIRETAAYDFTELTELLCYDQLRNKEKLPLAIGSLGGGNHFIEVDKDDTGNKYLIIHTGSRNLGKQIAKIYQKEAINYHKKNKMDEQVTKSIEKLKAENRFTEINDTITEIKQNFKTIPDKFAYLEGSDAANYLHDMKICQKFAKTNREVIADIILDKAFNIRLNNTPHFHTVHNYIDLTDNMTRKGAISAKKGERVLIPINMADGCIIGVGRGNPDWNYSAPHGAGRILSRSKAKETINLDDFKDVMNGVYSTSVCKETLDESPFAYKKADDILKWIKDTVDVVNIIKPIYNFKAH